VPLTTGRQHRADTGELDAQRTVVLGLLAQGNTDEVIAKRLGISSRTVRRISSELLEQLGARSRFQAGARAVARNWITGSE
jgi:DNA-binding NarL/FixJ family response regulator